MALLDEQPQRVSRAAHPQVPVSIAPLEHQYLRHKLNIDDAAWAALDIDARLALALRLHPLAHLLHLRDQGRIHFPTVHKALNRPQDPRPKLGIAGHLAGATQRHPLPSGRPLRQVAAVANQRDGHGSAGPFGPQSRIHRI